MSIASLPLMGIGNVGRQHRPGDRNHSLPLMGIGNMRFRQPAEARAPLITPHGDRKRPWR